MRQTEQTMTNNLSRLIMEMESKFQREEDFLKFQVYNLKLREILKTNQYDNVAIAQGLNEYVEPTLWYFIASDTNIKGIKIITPNVNQEIGAFLKPAKQYENEAWYQWHLKNAKTQWRVEDGKLKASRVISDARTSSQPIGVVEAEFYLNRFIEPIISTNYLGNGIYVEDHDGKCIYNKKLKSVETEKRVREKIKELQPGENYSDRQCILKSMTIHNSDWTIYYYVDKSIIAKQNMPIKNSTFGIIGISLVLVMCFMVIFSKVLSERIMRLKKCAEEISNGNLEGSYYTQDTDEIGIVTNSFARMVEQLNEMFNKVYKMEIEKKHAELKALQAMINPHFLYNCLSSIKWKAIRSENTEISEITGLLAKFYRTALNNGNQITSVKGELENIKSYIEIQQKIHDDDFETEYDIEEDCLQYKMLNFLLQPIVENAIKHGIDCKVNEDEIGRIKVSLHQEQEFLVFSIYNNGPIISDEQLQEHMNTQGKGYGIFNIRERIQIYYGEGCDIFPSVTENGETCFTIKIFKATSGI